MGMYSNIFIWIKKGIIFFFDLVDWFDNESWFCYLDYEVDIYYKLNEVGIKL